MSPSLALDVASVADSVTKTFIAFLTLVASVALVLGLARALAGRRRPQIVIEDIASLEGLPVSVGAGLSPQLRQAVRRALSLMTGDASYAHLKTLESDVKAGLLVTTRGTTVSAVTTELQASTRDSLTALSAGVRALAPQQADGLLAVLGACLPAQRGCVVRSFPILREKGGHSEAGLALEFAELGRAPAAVATFWARPATDGPVTGAAAGASDTMYDLLEPAAEWIAIRLVSRYLAQTGRLARRRLDLGRHRRAELLGLRLQLAGQLSLYAVRRREGFGRVFADQALEDLVEAARLLPDYFRSHSMQAGVHERVGASYLKAGSAAPARRAFIAAIDAYDRADELLRKSAERAPAAVTQECERNAQRRTKCRLLSGDTAHSERARTELKSWKEPSPATSFALFNAACLAAVAARTIKDDQDGNASVWEARAWHLLGRSLLVGGRESPWNQTLTDPELENLDPALRRRFCDELKKCNPELSELPDAEAQRLVSEVMSALRLPPPEPMPGAAWLRRMRAVLQDLLGHSGRARV